MKPETTSAPVIHIPVPPRIFAKLQEIAGFRPVDDWARQALIRAAEEAAPSLTSSAMWRSDSGGWFAYGAESEDPK